MLLYKKIDVHRINTLRVNMIMLSRVVLSISQLVGA